MSPYLGGAVGGVGGGGVGGELEGARRQQLMLHSQLAKNLFKMGQFGKILYLVLYYNTKY